MSYRWVMTDPPLYEIAAKGDFKGHGAHTYSLHFRACDSEALALAKLDDRRWAYFQRERGAVSDGAWIIWDGSRKIGSIPAHSAIRPNH